IEYIVRDFLNSIKPKLTDKEKRTISWNHKIDFEHEKKDEINKFIKEHFEEFKLLKKQDPLICYLLEKRDIITHHEFAGSMQGHFEENEQSGEKRITKRNFVPLYLQILEYQAPKVLGKRKNQVDFGDCVSNDKERDILMDKLVNDDMYGLLCQFFNSIKKFVEKFENTDGSKDPLPSHLR
ncbi:MAG TPA: hypothetical protein VKB83_02675, partial [Nitrosopumilaceae archaeon]|nr:hypothetical protein [Nitrosopumilaceae archaeon]